MSKSIIVLFTCLLTFQLSSCQEAKTKAYYKDYFDSHAEDLDPIEGIWTLNVARTLYQNETVVADELEEARSEWAIVKVDSIHYEVRPLMDGITDPSSGGFKASFAYLGSEGDYIYSADFYSPNWSVDVMATMSENNVLIYNYFVDQKYLESIYSPFHTTYKLHWAFYWIKSYPSAKYANLGDWVECVSK